MEKLRGSHPLTLTCPADVEVEADTTAGSVVTYPPAEAHDDTGVAPAVSYSHPSGSTFAVGTTDVVVSAVGAAQQEARCVFVVTVQQSTADAGVPPPGEPDAGIPDAGTPDDVSSTPIREPASGCASTSGTSATGWLALLGALTWMRRRRSDPARPS
jgi:large repetitive protein